MGLVPPGDVSRVGRRPVCEREPNRRPRSALAHDLGRRWVPAKTTARTGCPLPARVDLDEMGVPVGGAIQRHRAVGGDLGQQLGGRAAMAARRPARIPGTPPRGPGAPARCRSPGGLIDHAVSMGEGPMPARARRQQPSGRGGPRRPGGPTPRHRPVGGHGLRSCASVRRPRRSASSARPARFAGKTDAHCS